MEEQSYSICVPAAVAGNLSEDQNLMLRALAVTGEKSGPRGVSALLPFSVLSDDIVGKKKKKKNPL